MPPKTRVSAEMIVDAAFELTRESGADAVNARSIAGRLGCSTQPVLYRFKTVDEIKNAVYQKADEFHTEYITNFSGRYENPMLEMGMLYIKFAIEETHLFRFLFQSNRMAHAGLDAIIRAEEMAPLIDVFANGIGVDEAAAREAFLMLFLPVHGYASMLANNSMEYDKELMVKILYRTYEASIAAVKGEP